MVSWNTLKKSFRRLTMIFIPKNLQGLQINDGLLSYQQESKANLVLTFCLSLVTPQKAIVRLEFLVIFWWKTLSNDCQILFVVYLDTIYKSSAAAKARKQRWKWPRLSHGKKPQPPLSEPSSFKCCLIFHFSTGCRFSKISVECSVPSISAAVLG